MKKQIVSALIVSGTLFATIPYCYMNKVDLDSNNDFSIATSGVTNVQQNYLQTVNPIENYKYGFLKDRCNIRTDASEESEIIDVYDFNSIVCWTEYAENNEWAIIKYYDTIAFIRKDLIAETECPFNVISIPQYSGFKSFMDYKKITLKDSKQYKLQQCAYTGEYGIRMVNGRYCIAVGTGVNAEIGDYIDIVLENGELLNCIVGDIKDNRDTDYNNLITVKSNCCSEFIVETTDLEKNARKDGDISSIEIEQWDSPVVEMLVYKKNIFE